MKILIICSFNNNRISAYIEEQVNSLNVIGIETTYFLVKQKGIKGYLNEHKNLISKIKTYNPDIVHAYYGLSGLLANLQRKVPVITTYLGSDINNSKVFYFSLMSQFLSKYNIFVSKKNQLKSKSYKNTSIIPFGVETNQFVPSDKQKAREVLNIEKSTKMVLFAGAFSNTVKNAELAKKAIALFENVKLVPMGGYERELVPMLFNAADVCLMTSFSEGSPQFIKEAMSCNCPIVSVPVGDVPEVIENVEGCYLSSYNETELSEKIRLALEYGKKTNARQRIIELGWDSTLVAKKISDIYKFVISKNKN